MRKYLFIEFKRSITSKTVLFVLLFGMVLVIHQYYYYPSIGNTNQNFELAIVSDKANMILPDYLWGAWIGGDSALIHNYLFFFLVPIFATLSNGSSYLDDLRTKYIYNVFVRIKKKEYYLSKWIVTFIIGGFCVTIPLVLNFLLSMSRYSAMGPYPETFHTSIIDSSMLGQLFYNNPYVYILAYFALIFIFSGIYATFSLLITFVSDYKLVVLILPFLLTILITNFLSAIDLSFWSPQVFLNPANGQGDLLVVLIEMLLFSFISLGLFLWKGCYKERNLNE